MGSVFVQVALVGMWCCTARAIAISRRIGSRQLLTGIALIDEQIDAVAKGRDTLLGVLRPYIAELFNHYELFLVLALRRRSTQWPMTCGCICLGRILHSHPLTTSSNLRRAAD